MHLRVKLFLGFKGVIEDYQSILYREIIQQFGI